MKVQNKANGKPYEMTKKEWDSLGKSQKAFTVIDTEDSPSIKEQTITNTIGKREQPLTDKKPLQLKPPAKANQSETKQTPNE
jgi:hypothetical protein